VTRLLKAKNSIDNTAVITTVIVAKRNAVRLSLTGNSFGLKTVTITANNAEVTIIAPSNVRKMPTAELLVGGNNIMNGNMMRVAMNMDVSAGISPFTKNLALPALEITNAMMLMSNKTQYASRGITGNGMFNVLKTVLKAKINTGNIIRTSSMNLNFLGLTELLNSIKLPYLFYSDHNLLTNVFG